MAYLHRKDHRGWPTPTPSCTDRDTESCNGQDPTNQGSHTKNLARAFPLHSVVSIRPILHTPLCHLEALIGIAL